MVLERYIFHFSKAKIKIKYNFQKRKMIIVSEIQMQNRMKFTIDSIDD